MTNTAFVTGTDLWASSLDRTAGLAQAAEHALHQAEQAAPSVGRLAAMSPMVLAVLAVGLALWLVGDRLFRPASSLVGAGIGALLGLVLAGSIQAETVLGVPTPYAAIGLGSLLGLGIGAAMYRIAVGGAAALTLGGVAAVLAAAISLHQPSPDSAPGPGSLAERPETIAQASLLPRAEATITHASLGESVTIDTLQAAAASAGSIMRAEWTALPEQTQSLVLAAAILGCVIGFAGGLIRPRTAGPAVAALAGAALWLGATTTLLARAGQPLPAMPTQQPGAWLAAWLLVALVGFGVQRKVIRPSALVAKDE